jgi:hypothetical protein
MKIEDFDRNFRWHKNVSVHCTQSDDVYMMMTPPGTDPLYRDDPRVGATSLMLSPEDALRVAQMLQEAAQIALSRKAAAA